MQQLSHRPQRPVDKLNLCTLHTEGSVFISWKWKRGSCHEYLTYTTYLVIEVRCLNKETSTLPTIEQPSHSKDGAPNKPQYHCTTSNAGSPHLPHQNMRYVHGRFAPENQACTAGLKALSRSLPQNTAFGTCLSHGSCSDAPPSRTVNCRSKNPVRFLYPPFFEQAKHTSPRYSKRIPTTRTTCVGMYEGRYRETNTSTHRGNIVFSAAYTVNLLYSHAPHTTRAQ